MEIRADKARLGIESPKEVMPHRREVYEAMKQRHEEKKRTDRIPVGLWTSIRNAIRLLHPSPEGFSGLFLQALDHGNGSTAWG